MIGIAELIDLGDIVRMVREKKRIKGEEEIEARLHVNKGTLSRIERTSKYDPASLERIARGLGTTAADLLAARDAIKGVARPQKQTYLYCALHDPLHRKLERILEGQEYWAQAIMANIEAMWAASTGNAPLAASGGESDQPPAGARPGDKMRRSTKASE